MSAAELSGVLSISSDSREIGPWLCLPYRSLPSRASLLIKRGPIHEKRPGTTGGGGPRSSARGMITGRRSRPGRFLFSAGSRRTPLAPWGNESIVHGRERGWMAINVACVGHQGLSERGSGGRHWHGGPVVLRSEGAPWFCSPAEPDNRLYL